MTYFNKDPNAIERSLPLNEIEFRHGLPHYKGRQVLIYKNDYSGIYHVSNCSIIQDMQPIEKDDQYCISNDISNKIGMIGSRLRVCKNCLNALNYKNFRHDQKNTFIEFSIEKFFASYSSFFDHMPMNACHYRGDSDLKGNYIQSYPR